MKRYLVASLFLFSLAAVGCSPTAEANHNNGAPLPAAKTSPATASNATDTLPAPKTTVRLQVKYTKAFPREDGSKPFYEVVNQWVFQRDNDTDDSLICVGDGEHCITLIKLKEQLDHPLNDPLGIR